MSESRDPLASLAFKKRGSTYQGSVPLQDLTLLRNDPAETMRIATATYADALGKVKRWQNEARHLRRSKISLTARKAWELGDIIDKLADDVEAQGCQIEKLYDHLERHAQLPAKRGSSFVTLRRYVPDPSLIPADLRWNDILKTVKSSAQSIASGTYRED